MRDIAAATEPDVIDAVRAAREARTPLNIVGARTKRHFGRPVANCGTVLDVSGLKGIVDYRPEELIITAKPGTPVAEIEAALTEKNQRLGFDPPDLGPLFGVPKESGTIGGAISCDLNGSAAVHYGRVRDHLLGIRAVNGYGEAFKAGGKVVKNVTGFDIPKLVCGAFGTLCVLTEVTFRVFPKPQSSATFVLGNMTPERGLALLRRVWASPLEPTGLAYLPAPAAEVVGLRGDAALIRLEGAAMPLEEKRAALRILLTQSDIVELQNGDTVFARIGSGRIFAEATLDAWRVAVPPSDATAVVKELNAPLWCADWAGGLLWLGLKDGSEVHDIAARHGGHATLIRGNSDTPFPPLSAGQLALTRAVKAAFDPLGLFNPGRMVEGV